VPRKQRLSVRLDVPNAWMWQGEQRLTLTPKAFAVLRYLSRLCHRVVTTEALVQAVWAGTVVSEAAVMTCIQEIRHTLRERSQAQQHIATGHRRGTAGWHPVPRPHRHDPEPGGQPVASRAESSSK
jgi:DNA-binding response OmpR family regulator